MNKRAFIGFLNQVETTYPVAEWRVRGVQVWPVIRAHLFAQNYGGMIVEAALAGGLRNNIRAVVGGLIAWGWASVRDRSASVRAGSRADVVFLSYSVGRQPLIGGKRYNPLLAPYVALLRSLGKDSRVWEMSPYGDYNTPRHDPSCFVQPALFALRLQSVLIGARRSDSEMLENYESFVSKVREAGLRFGYANPGALRRDAWYIRKLADRWKADLCRTGATHGFVADYGLRERAFHLACRELGVVSVEIQHGVQGPSHPLYSCWLSVPPGGYELCPRAYWCWDLESAATIRAWADHCRNGPFTVVGGEPMRELFIQGSHEVVARCDALIEKHTTTREMVPILITLDSIGPAIPTELLRALRSAPADWVFWIRLHPVNQRLRLPEITRLLKQNQVRHVDIELATSLPLAAILRHVRVHVTAAWSSVIREAEEFGVPSVACEARAAEIFERETREGTLAVADSAAAILSAIARQLRLWHPVEWAERPDSGAAMRAVLSYGWPQSMPA